MPVPSLILALVIGALAVTRNAGAMLGEFLERDDNHGPL